MTADLIVLALGQAIAAVLLVPGVIALMAFNPLSFLTVPLSPRDTRRLIVLWVLAYGLVAAAVAVVGYVNGDGLGPGISVLAVIAALLGLRWALQRYVWQAWRTGKRSHRWAAVLTSLVGPGTFALFLATLPGLDANERMGFVLTGALALVMSYGFALFIFRWLGGDYDPRPTKTYRKRP